MCSIWSQSLREIIAPSPSDTVVRHARIVLTRQYPKLFGAEVKVHVIQSRDHILNTYSEKISEYAESKFARNDVKLWTNAR